MAKPGEITENPISGERCRWLVTSAETAGRSTRAEFWTRPGGGVPTMHVHREADERFEVLAGELTARVGDETIVLRPGEHATLPKGIPHCWTATGDEELHFVVEVTPAGNFEAGIETMFQMAREGYVRKNGFPHLLPFAAHHRMLLHDVYPVSPPRWVLRLVLGLLEPFARWRLAT
jgi:quercetin dioxygenase-like cupin family protein